MGLTITALTIFSPDLSPTARRHRRPHRHYPKTASGHAQRVGKVEVGNDSSVAPPKMEQESSSIFKAAKKREIVASFAETDAFSSRSC